MHLEKEVERLALYENPLINKFKMMINMRSLITIKQA